MCRPAVTSCDIAEFCTGRSAECPKDYYIRDGVTCDEGLTCASGQCTSRDEQCLGRGSVMNVTKSCQNNNEACKMSCNKPGSKSQCLLFSGNFIDGTPCGIGGSCKAGSCQNSDTASHHWAKENLKILIPVCIVAFLFVCGFLFWFGCWRCTGYKEKRQIPKILSKRHSTDVAGNTRVSPAEKVVVNTPNSSSSSFTVLEQQQEKNQL